MKSARCMTTKLCVVLPPKRVRSVSLWGGYTSVLEFLMSLYLCIYVTQIDNQEISQTHKWEDSWEQDPRCRSPELGKQMTDFNSSESIWKAVEAWIRLQKKWGACWESGTPSTEGTLAGVLPAGLFPALSLFSGLMRWTPMELSATPRVPVFFISLFKSCHPRFKITLHPAS